MSLQREHFLLSYLNTVSVGPAGVFAQQTGAYQIELPDFFASTIMLWGASKCRFQHIQCFQSLSFFCFCPIQIFAEAVVNFRRVNSCSD